jgi:hypothetical protein
MRHYQNLTANIQTRQIHLAFFIRKNPKIKRFLNKKLNLVVIVIFLAPKRIRSPLEVEAITSPLTVTDARDTLCSTIFIYLFWFVKTAPKSGQRARKILLSEPPEPIQNFTTAKHLGHRPS